MNARILSSESHAVIVQKVQLRSVNKEPATNPGDFFTCCRERIASRKNEGRKRIDRTRSRVRLTNTIGQYHTKGLVDQRGLNTNLGIDVAQQADRRKTGFVARGRLLRLLGAEGLHGLDSCGTAGWQSCGYKDRDDDQSG
jgi:hypothetical protein